MALRTLSLCSGIGGLDLGVELAVPGSAVVCYVEREVYPAAVLAWAMEAGYLAAAPVWSDLATFDGGVWRGKVEMVTAGLPCQPYSVAGKRGGERDERYVWPDFFRILEECESPLVFLENVPGLLAWFEPIGERLCRLGYELEAGLFSAEEVGAPHRRERLFVLGCRVVPDTLRHFLRDESRRSGRARGSGEAEPGDDGSKGVAVGQADCHGARRSEQRIGRVFDGERATFGHDADGRGSEGSVGVAQGDTDCSGPQGRGGFDNADKWLPWPPGREDEEGWRIVGERRPDLQFGLSVDEETVESAVRSVVDGFSDRVDQLRALGNGVVPLQAAHALRTLAARLGLSLAESRER